jgi:hypothetical protein
MTAVERSQEPWERSKHKYEMRRLMRLFCCLTVSNTQQLTQGLCAKHLGVLHMLDYMNRTTWTGKYYSVYIELLRCL